MPGPSGFTQRFTGKIKTGQLWIGRQQQNGNGSVVAYSTLGTQTIDSDAIRAGTIASSSAISIFTLGGPPRRGHEIDLVISNSSGTFIKMMAGSFVGSTLSAVIKSTQPLQTITLLGLSTLLWGLKNVYPETTLGGAQPGGVTLSLTT